MAITGPVKLFNKSFADISYEATTVAVSSGTDTRDGPRTRRTYERWISVGSDDATTETWTVTFEESRVIDRLLIQNHNFKAFDVKWWDGDSWEHFTSVVTQAGAQTNIVETVYAKDSSYYEFASVTTTKVQISITSTQTVDAEKYMFGFYPMKEIGTFTGYPVLTPSNSRPTLRKTTLGGRTRTTILGSDTWGCSLAFAGYPVAADHTIMQTIWDLRDDFMIYPCGGKEQVRFQDVVGMRLRDIFLVRWDNDFSPYYTQNVYVLGLNYTAQFVEVA